MRGEDFHHIDLPSANGNQGPPNHNRSNTIEMIKITKAEAARVNIDVGSKVVRCAIRDGLEKYDGPKFKIGTVINMYKVELSKPAPYNRKFAGSNKEAYCEYHDNRGHNIVDYPFLKNNVEQMIQSGQLDKLKDLSKIKVSKVETSEIQKRDKGKERKSQMCLSSSKEVTAWNPRWLTFDK